MIQKDYIMRMIEQLTAAIAKILKLGDTGKQEEAIKEMENAFSNTIGLNLPLLDSFSVDNIAEMFGISKDRASAGIKCLAAAKLLKLRADLLNVSEPQKYSDRYHKVLGFYIKGLSATENLEIDKDQYCSDVRQIEKELAPELTSSEKYALFELYRTIGQYDRAEELLFHLKSIQYPGITKTGISFFEDLQAIDDTVLISYGLTKGEVNETLNDFLKSER
jgi:DNA-binding transcriptional regulator GbsR (MarR family)